MKIEIDNDNSLFRITDGEEDGITGQIVSYGEKSILDETVPEAEQWWAEIDENGECDGLAHKGNFPDSVTAEPVSFELDCEFEEDEEEGDEDEEEEEPEITQ
jgi:hypothetical protein